MGRKGDVLELIDGAPGGTVALSGSVWRWTHHERSRRAIETLTQRINVRMATATFGGSTGETTDEHLRVTIGLPDRWRLESETRVDVYDGTTRWIGKPSRVTELTHSETDLGDTDVGMMIQPGPHLFGLLKFADPVQEFIAGRLCWKVDATVSVSRHLPRMTFASMRLGGVDHTFWFDADTGIVLRHVGLVDGEPCSITEFKEVVFDPAISELDFAFLRTPGAVVERQVDQMIRLAEMHGISLVGVDQDDAKAVQEAINAGLHSSLPASEARLAIQKARHVPVGDPPADESTARKAIEYVFSHHDEVDGSGRDLVNVQGGQRLAGPLTEARGRVPGGGGTNTSIVVDDILFLRSDEAVVWFSVEVDGGRLPMVNGREGRAVKVDDRWLIERATIADLLRLAGVNVPPPE
jgi:outer membrane lipoprotein-sorting protein